MQTPQHFSPPAGPQCHRRTAKSAGGGGGETRAPAHKLCAATDGAATNLNTFLAPVGRPANMNCHLARRPDDEDELARSSCSPDGQAGRREIKMRNCYHFGLPQQAGDYELDARSAPVRRVIAPSPPANSAEHFDWPPALESLNQFPTDRPASQAGGQPASQLAGLLCLAGALASSGPSPGDSRRLSRVVVAAAPLHRASDRQAEIAPTFARHFDARARNRSSGKN